MAAAFNLTAQLNLRGPNNVKNIVADIRRELGTITGDVNLRIDPAATQNITRLNTALTTLNNNLRSTQTNATDAANAMRQFTASISGIGNSTNSLNRNLNNAATAAQRVGQQAQSTSRQVAGAATAMEEFGRQSQLAVKRFIAFSAGTAGVVTLIGAVRKGIDAFVEFDKQFVKLQQVTGESATGLSKLANTISSLSIGLGVSSSELTEVSSTLAQAGLSARDTERALKALALSSLAPSFDNMNQTVEGSIALMRQFDISAADLEKSLGAVNAVAAKFAVESSDIIAAIQRTGGVFASASRGVSEGTDALNEFIAVFTSVRATTRESAETIATGLRTIFTRIQRGGTIEALKEFGVNLTDAEGKFVGAYKAVQLLSEGLNRIDPRDLKFSEIVEELGGFRQIGKVIPLIQQFATAQEALKVAQAGQSSLAEDAALAQLSLANQASKVREEFLALFREIGGSDTFQTMAKGALSLASALISVADSVKGVLPVLAIMGAFRGASALRQFGSGFAGGFSSSGGMRGLGNRLGGGRQTNAKGGFIKRYRSGGDVEQVPVALMPGEAVIFPEDAARIGSSTLKRMNYADKRQKRAKGGKIGMVPGQGNSDSFYTTLPAGSFVIRKAATEAMGPGFIGDVAKGRQKFATGGPVSGPVSDLGGSLIRSSVRETSFTYDKDVGKKFDTSGSKPTKFNTKDKYNYIRIDRRINVDEVYSDAEKKTNPVYKEYKRLSTSSKYGSSKTIRGNSASNRGYAFEKVLQDRIKNLSLENKSSNEFSRLDGTIGPNVFEAKSVQDKLSNEKLSEKVVSAALTNKGKSEKIMSNRLTSNLLDSKANTIDLGSVILFQDVTSGLGQEKETGTKTETKEIPKNKRPAKAQAYGGYVQKLMAGTFVKSTAGRKKKQILADITKAEAEKLPSSTIIGELSISTIESMLRQSGVPLSANDLMRKKNLSEKEMLARSQVIDAYVTKINSAAQKNRDQNITDTKASSRAGLLFGAVGMFGSPFPAENIQITKGLKNPTDIRVFGAVLDRNKVAREARLQKRAEKLQKINTKRVAKGKSELKDIYSLDIMGAPIASDKSREYTREEISGIKNRRNQSIIKEAEAALKLGLTGFFDFDDTSVIGRTAFPAGYKEEKPIKGQTAKSPDYTLFGNMNAVGEGLEKAKPTPLMRKLVKVLRKTKKTDTNLYNALVSRINILSARPDDTMKQVVRPWLRSQGLDLPETNVIGVGATGLSAKGVAAAKTGSMLQKAGASSSFIVDDSEINTNDARAAGIRSYTYSPKVDLDRATRKSLADVEGAKFENDLKAVLQERSPLLYQAMSQESETHRSIDFPYGLGPNIARGWFNNSLLSNIPVDAKRTLSGPRGVILKNITNYLKARNYAIGGIVQKLASGGQSKVDYYSLEKGSGFSGPEFDSLVNFAKTNQLSLPEFKSYLQTRAQQKKNKAGLMMNPASLLGAITPETPTASAKQTNLARSLMGSPDAKFNPKYDNARKFAAGGEVPILAQEGEYVINRNSARAIGYDNLSKLNKYHSGGKVQKLAKGGSSASLSSLGLSGIEDDASKLGGTLQKLLFEIDRKLQIELKKVKTASPGISNKQARKEAGKNTLEALNTTLAKAGVAPTSVTPQQLDAVIKQGYTDQATASEKNQGRVVRRGTAKADDEAKIKSVQQSMQRVFGTLENDLLDLVDAGAKAAKAAKENARKLATEASDKAGKNAERKAKRLANRAGDKARDDLLASDPKATRTQLNKAAKEAYDRKLEKFQPKIKEEKNKAYSSTLKTEMKKVKPEAQAAQNAANVALNAQGIATKDLGPGRRKMLKSQIQDRVRSEQERIQTSKQDLIQNRFDTLRGMQNVSNPALSGFKGRAINLGRKALGMGEMGTAGIRRDPGSLMKQATSEVDKIFRLETRRAAETEKQLRLEREKTNESQKQRNNNRGGPDGPTNGGSGGPGRGGNRRGSDNRNTGGGFSNMAMGLSFAIPMVADMIAGGEAKSESAARSNALTQGAATSAGSGLMLGSMASEMLGGGKLGMAGGIFTGVATAAIGIVKAFADAENAAREFAITAATDKLETSLERSSNALDKWEKDLKSNALSSEAEKNVRQSVVEAENVSAAKNRTQRGLVNFTDTGEGSAERSQILFEKGIGSYLQTIDFPFASKDSNNYTQGQRNQAAEFASMIPGKARQEAKNFAGSADAITRFIENKIRTGSTLNDIRGEGDTPTGASKDFISMAKSLALADSAVQEEIMNIKNSTQVKAEEKQTIIDGIIARSAERKALDIQTRVLKAQELESFNRATNHLQNSMERMFQNMEQAIGKNIFELDKLSQQAELSAAALSGQAKAGSVRLKSINVLQNPRAYTSVERDTAASRAAGMFGSESGTVKGLLQASGRLEDTIMSTINNTIKEDPTAGNEKIGIRIQNNLKEALQNLKLPPDVADKLGKEVNTAMGQIRTKGDEKIDFGDLMEKIPQLGKVMDITRRAQEAAVKALEHWQGALNDYGNSMNQIVDLQVEANARLRRASDIGSRGQMELDKALGKEISLRNQMSVALAGVRSQTGGATNPVDIGQNIRNLETRRASLESMSNTAGQRGFSGKDEFMLMQNRLRNTNLALRENYDALKSMADNTEMASIAMSKINEIQQKRQAGVNMAERLVTSSPEELSSLNRAMDRLNNNMAGNLNVGSTADQRKESLDAFNMIAPFLGEQQNAMKANVLESMLLESGVGVNGIMAEAIQSLRNPEGDPQMQEAIAEYKKAVELQQTANSELARLNTLIAQNTAETSATKLAGALNGVKFDFQSAQLNDIASGIKTLIEVVKGKPGVMGAAPKANGGLIYAAAGQLVDFQPKGTDTVPAMLTPGEFVVNRAATQRNLPLLNKINSGGYSRGGRVKYYNRGGFVSRGDSWSLQNSDEAAERYSESSSDDTPKETTATYPVIPNKDIRFVNVKTAPYSFYASAGSPLDNITDTTTTVKGRQGRGYDRIEWEHSLADTAMAGGVGAGAGVVAGYAVAGALGLLAAAVSATGVGVPAGAGLLALAAGIVSGVGVGVGAARKVASISAPAEASGWTSPVKAKDIGSIPSTDFYRDILDPEGAIKEQKLSIDDIALYASKIKAIRDMFEFSSEIETIKNNMIDGSDQRPDITVKTEAEASASKIKVAMKGLTHVQKDKYFGLFENDPMKGASPGNPFGFNQQSIGQYSIAAGPSIKSLLPANSFDSVKGFDQSNSSDQIEKDLGKAIKAKEKIDNIIAKLKIDGSGDPNPEMTETAESISNKDFIRNLSEVYDGTKLYAQVGEEFFRSDNVAGAKLPITLYNQNTSENWQNYADQLTKLNQSNNFKFSKNKSDFIPLLEVLVNREGGKTRVGEKNLAWTDAGFNDMGIFSGAEAALESSVDGKNVEYVSELFDSPNYKFSYLKMKSKLWSKRPDGTGARRYMGEKQEFFVIPPQQGSDVTFNPFANLTNAYLYFKNKQDLENILKQAPKEEYKYRFNTPNMGLLDHIGKDDKLGIEDNTFATTDNINPALSNYEFVAEQYKNASEERLRKARSEQATADTRKDFVGAKDKIFAVNDAMRVTIARQVARWIENNPGEVPQEVVKASLKEADIKSVEDIKRAASAIESVVPGNLKPQSYNYQKIDAWRAAFREIYNDKEAKLLQQLGLDMSPEAFGAPKTAQNELGENIPVWYPNAKDQAGYLKKLVDREITIKTGGTTSTAFQKSEADNLNLKNSIAFGQAGGGQLVTEDTEIKNWNDLRKNVLDTQRVFPDASQRSDLLNKLFKFYDNGKNASGDPLIPDPRLKQDQLNRISSIQKYFSEFDKLVNYELQLDPENATENKDNKGPWSEGQVAPTYFSTSLARIQSEDGIANWNDFSGKFVEPFNLENTKAGPLTADHVAKILMETGRIKSEELKKAEDPVRLATGGMVYANKGTLVNYQPRGTDTVPAMLTPGEFVINRESTSKYLPVLRAINSGSYSHGDLVKHFNNGGIVTPRYYADPPNSPIPGSVRKDPFDFSKYMGDLANKVSSAIATALEQIQINPNNQPLQQQSSNGVSSDSGSISSINEFTNRLKSIADTLAGLGSIPKEIQITATHTHNIIINGDAALNKLSPDLQNIAMGIIKEKFRELVQKNQTPGAPLVDPFNDPSTPMV